MSLDDDRNLLQAVRDYLPPNELHKIATTAWDLYESNKNSLPNDAVESLRETLNGMRTDLKQLGEAIFGLARFMIYATETLGDAATGEKVADLVREYAHLYEPFWEMVGTAIGNLSGEAAANFQSFTGADGAPKTAPQFGKAPPQGTVPLRNLAPPVRPPPAPARPPPWSKKK